MKSTFFHIGVNRTMAQKYHLQEPQIQSDGSIPYVPLPEHNDPNFDDLTYGDPWGRLALFNNDDVAFFIESGTISKNDWGYYLVAYFVVETVYTKHQGVWIKSPLPIHYDQVSRNAHEIREDLNYSIIFGKKELSRLLFLHPLRISKGQDVYPEIKPVLRLPDEPTYGYWFKRWLGHNITVDLLSFIGAPQNSISSMKSPLRAWFNE